MFTTVSRYSATVCIACVINSVSCIAMGPWLWWIRYTIVVVLYTALTPTTCALLCINGCIGDNLQKASFCHSFKVQERFKAVDKGKLLLVVVEVVASFLTIF